jgi:hypothetical protein
MVKAGQKNPAQSLRASAQSLRASAQKRDEHGRFFNPNKRKGACDGRKSRKGAVAGRRTRQGGAAGAARATASGPAGAVDVAGQSVRNMINRVPCSEYVTLF